MHLITETTLEWWQAHGERTEERLRKLFDHWSYVSGYDSPDLAETKELIWQETRELAGLEQETVAMQHIAFPSVLTLAHAEYAQQKELWSWGNGDLSCPRDVRRIFRGRASDDAWRWHRTRTMPSWLMSYFDHLGVLYQCLIVWQESYRASDGKVRELEFSLEIEVYVPRSMRGRREVIAYLTTHPDIAGRERGRVIRFRRKLQLSDVEKVRQLFGEVA